MPIRRYGRHAVETAHEDKVFFPDARLTKGDLIEYYERVADRLLPYLEDRPLVIQRFPDGIAHAGFYQKQVGGYFPNWVTTVRVEVESRDGRQELVVCDRKATLIYLADQGAVTLHPWLSRRDRLDHPDQLVVDLDPPRDDFAAVRTAAFRVRDLLHDLELPAYLKLTGSSGVHVVVPLDRRAAFDTVRRFARDAMDLLAARHPNELTTEQRKHKRRGRLYLDTGRNAYGQTAVAPWTVRPLPHAPLAVPLAWPDLARSDLGPRDYTVANVWRRVSHRDDPWAGIWRHPHSIGPARERLDRLRTARKR